MNETLRSAINKANLVSASGLTIYDAITVEDDRLRFTAEELEVVFKFKLKGLNLSGLPLRTRSKVVKVEICKAMGYPVPKAFKKVQPRFYGQSLDIYVQKSNNLQVWNEDLSFNRRYGILKVNASDQIVGAKVITGADLGFLDTTGTLTQKYQAKLTDVEAVFELVCDVDSDNLRPLTLTHSDVNLDNHSPNEVPRPGYLLPIAEVFHRLKPVVGSTFINPGADQERNRGAELHRLCCQALGYATYRDNGRFPDIFNQLLEVKLQTSSTIDLGLITPDSEDFMDMARIQATLPRYRDVRYAVFYAAIENDTVKITNLIVTNGLNFFARMPRFEGKVLNKKLQIKLPNDFFDL